MATGASRRANPPFKLSSPSSKQKGKTRKRGRIVLIKQIRAFALFFSAAFVFALFCFELPHYSSFPPVSTPTIGWNLSASQVDINMHDLYNVIEFKNVDGGAWKQGWDVQYTGFEWNKRKLQVFVVPHSHNDPGWLRTVDEYYQERTRRILSTIVQALRKDKNRKFIWEEMSYLEMWWRDATEAEMKDFIKLVKSGQLEIVGGGWVMNDEANSHYFAIIEQMIEGNMWLQETIGVIPENAWAIDPFGHSPTMAYLLRRMGFKNMLIQRTHYEVKKVLAQQQNLEFMWRQSWDKENSTDILCHMMPFYSYDIPHTCGPEPAVCCQFDYWRLPGFGSAQRCPWGFDPQLINEDNVKERAEKLLDQYRKKSTLYRTNTLLVPLGDDFRYITLAEADLQFENYQKIFDYINKHNGLKAKVQFGTLNDYFSALRAEVVAISKAEKGNMLSATFPALSGDFFTYADRVQDYWSGYYVTRPFYKSVDRVLEETLRAADILFAFSMAYCKLSHSDNYPLYYGEKIIAARRTLALFQHHDGITGTAKNHVVVDYAKRMQGALFSLESYMARAVGILLGGGVSDGVCNHDLNLEFFEPEQLRVSHDTLPLRKVVELNLDQVRRVVIYNPLQELVNQVVMVFVEDADVCVLDIDFAAIESQVSPEIVGSQVTNGRKHRLHWRAQIPPMGLQTFFILRFNGMQPCQAAQFAEIKVFNAPDMFICPSPFKCTHPGPKEDVVEIQNRHQTLAFSVSNGLLLHVKKHKDDAVMAVRENIGMYTSRGSGAYLFKPIGEAESIVHSGGLMVVTKGQLMQEVYTRPNGKWTTSPVSRSACLYDGEGSSVQAHVVEMTYHMELLGYDYNDKELIVRFDTELDTSSAFFSDLNGFQTIARETWKKIPLQGNYYPMPSVAFLQDPGGWRFSVHSRQALGVASLESGWLEVMLDRRLSRDDGRGMEQGVLDNRPMDVVFHLLVENNVSSLPEVAHSTPRVPSLLSHRVLAQLNYPIHFYFGRTENVSSAPSLQLLKSFSPLAAHFPCDLHVVNFKSMFPRTTPYDISSIPSFAFTLQRRGWDPSYCWKGHTLCTTSATSKWKFADLFSHLSIVDMRTSSLNLLHDDHSWSVDADSLGRKELSGGSLAVETLIDLPPMEIQSWKLRMRKGDYKFSEER